MQTRFRFESIEVWRDSIQLSADLFFVVERANAKKQFGFASQFYRALISVSNNIAEGSGSVSKKEFAQFLNISHRSAFECANMLHLGKVNYLIAEEEFQKFIPRLERICRQLEGFRRHLLKT